MLSPGIYDCKVISAYWSESSKKKTPCIAVLVEIEDFSEPQPVQLVGNIYTTTTGGKMGTGTIGTKEKPGFAVHQLRALGYSGTFVELHDPERVLVGKTGKCTLELDTRGQIRIGQFGTSGPARIRAELSFLEALDAGNTQGAAPAAPENEEAPASPPPQDNEYSATADDIPF